MAVCCWCGQKAIEVAEKKGSSDCLRFYWIANEIEDDFGQIGSCCPLDSGDPHPIHHHDLLDDL